MKKRKGGRLIPLFLLLIATLSLCYERYQARDHIEPNASVINVSDGDTFRAIMEGEEKRIRLSNIDCPERGQDFGSKARRYAHERLMGKQIHIRVDGTDQYGRILGTVILEDGVNLNEDLVKNGLAWRYLYSSNQRISDYEQEARAEKKGLWSLKEPMAPWEFRKNKRFKNTREKHVKR